MRCVSFNRDCPSVNCPHYTGSRFATMPKVNHEILKWARETAGLSREEAVRKLSIRDAWGMKAVDRLAALESGAAEPTRPTLVKMAGHYRRPLLTFYLSTPPRIGDRDAGFRTLSSDRPSGTEALVDALIRDAHVRQSMVRAALEDKDEADRLEFVGSNSVSDGRSAILAALGSLIDVSMQMTFYTQPNPTATHSICCGQRVEDGGAFVLLKGDLGSYHTAIDTEVFRGFVISDEVAPFIVINDRDARPAWSFTLLHECVHLILGQSGMRSDWEESSLERFCDDVAGEFLLPTEELNLLDLSGTSESDSLVEQRISEFAEERNLSRSMVAYRAYRADLIARSTYRSLDSLFRGQWMQERGRRRERNRDTNRGPDYYVVRRHRVGRSLIQLAGRMMRSGAFSTSEAARVLGVRPTQVGEMIYPVRPV